MGDWAPFLDAVKTCDELTLLKDDKYVALTNNLSEIELKNIELEQTYLSTTTAKPKINKDAIAKYQYQNSKFYRDQYNSENTKFHAFNRPGFFNPKISFAFKIVNFISPKNFTIQMTRSLEKLNEHMDEYISVIQENAKSRLIYDLENCGLKDTHLVHADKYQEHAVKFVMYKKEYKYILPIFRYSGTTRTLKQIFNLWDSKFDSPKGMKLGIFEMTKFDSHKDILIYQEKRCKVVVSHKHACAKRCPHSSP